MPEPNRPLKKLMIRTWRGPLPEWTPQFRESVKPLEEFGWRFLIMENWDWFRVLCQVVLDVQIPPEIDTRKPGDYDPALGDVFSHHLPEADWFKQYDFWGHFNLDCVYGRLSHFLPDAFLANIDIYGNDPGAVCGPFTLYRNCEKVNRLYRNVPTWKRDFENPTFLGWDEVMFNGCVNRTALHGEIRFASGFLQAHDHMTIAHRNFVERYHATNFAAENGGTFIPCLPPVSWVASGISGSPALIDNVTRQEIMMYHFNQTRRWPVG